MAERLASQEEFNKRVNPYSLTTVGVKAADAATFGYLPQIINYMNPKVPVEAARKIIDAAADENPTAAKVGTGLGYTYDAALAATGVGALASGLGVGGAAAPTIYATRLGLAPGAAPAATNVLARAGQLIGPAATRANIWGLTKAGAGAAVKVGKPTLGLATAASIPAAASYMLGADADAQRGGSLPESKNAPASKQLDIDTSQYSWPSPEAEQQFKLSMAAYNKSLQRGGDGPTMLNRDAAVAGTDSVAAQYWGQIHNADGSLKPGITPAMEARARLAVEYDAKSKAMGDNTRVAVPLDAFPGGEAGARLWQNQYGEASGLAATNGNVPVRLADAISSPQVMGAAQQFAQAQAQAGASDAQRRAPVSFSQVMDMYEEAFPGNVGGPRTPDQRAADVERDYRERVQARENAIDAQYIGLGKQVGITDPNVAIALGRGGQFTRGFMDTMLGQQQGPPATPRTPSAKDIVLMDERTLLTDMARAIEQMPDGPEKERRAAVLEARSKRFLELVATGDAPLITPGVPIE